jgi:hypothetical protein
MSKYKTLLLIYLLCNFTANAQMEYENDSIIIWGNERKINWNDFKSESKSKNLKYQDALAHINFSLNFYPKKISCSKVDSVKILAQMYKNESWVGAKTFSNELLNHEQTHFDIAELYARKIRKAIADFLAINPCHLQSIADIFYRLEDEHWEVQFLYDEEVRVCEDEEVIICFNLEKQKEWDQKIAIQLEEYKDYELVLDANKID